MWNGRGGVVGVGLFGIRMVDKRGGDVKGKGERGMGDGFRFGLGLSLAGWRWIWFWFWFCWRWVSGFACAFDGYGTSL